MFKGFPTVPIDTDEIPISPAVSPVGVLVTLRSSEARRNDATLSFLPEEKDSVTDLNFGISLTGAPTSLVFAGLSFHV
jgi:hypothetical protein